MDDSQKIFTKIYDQVQWHGGWNNTIRETKSGSGSTIKHTQNCINFINNIISDNNIKTILDLGCGEMNWQKTLNITNIEKYVGVDIVKNVISQNQAYYKNDPRFTFICDDITNYSAKGYDLVICRETLFHLPLKNSLQILDNVKKGGNKFFITSTHVESVNRNIPLGGFYQINVEAPPFKMGKPYAKIRETLRKNRYLYLYSL